MNGNTQEIAFPLQITFYLIMACSIMAKYSITK